MQKLENSGHGIWYAATFLILGLFGAVLRGLELARHFDRAAGLFTDFAAAPVLPVYTVVCIAAAAVCAWLHRGEAGDFLEVYRIRRRSGILVRLLLGAALSAAGILKTISAIRVLLQELALAQLYDTFRVVSGLTIASLIFGLLTILAGLGYLSLTASRAVERFGDMSRFFSSVPIFWSCFLLVLTFMEHPVEPVLRSYAYDILAGCAMVYGLYRFIARAYGSLHRSPGVFSSLAGVMLLTLCVGGRIAAALLSGDPVWVTEVAFRMAAFLICDCILLVDAVPLLNAGRRKADEDISA